jgi:hypothetical protein
MTSAHKFENVAVLIKDSLRDPSNSETRKEQKRNKKKRSVNWKARISSTINQFCIMALTVGLLG